LWVGAASLFRNHRFRYVVFPQKTFFRSLLGGNGICHQAVIYRKNVFEKVGHFQTIWKLAADYEHFWSCFLEGLRVRTSREVLVNYDAAGASAESWNHALDEFEAISLGLRAQLSWPLYAWHRLLLFWNQMKIKTIKFVKSRGGRLEPLWIWWNRRTLR